MPIRPRAEPAAGARLRAVVSGRVQGVNFRWSTVREARGLGLTGWVRNRPDGTVETVAEGPRARLERFLAYLNDGPPAAMVTGVEAAWSDATGEFGDFGIR